MRISFLNNYPYLLIVEFTANFLTTKLGMKSGTPLSLRSNEDKTVTLCLFIDIGSISKEKMWTNPRTTLGLCYKTKLKSHVILLLHFFQIFRILVDGPHQHIQFTLMIHIIDTFLII